MKENCKTCNGQLKIAFEKIVLKKYNVKYYQCEDCGFIQTEEPYWLKEAYESAITALDIGILDRNIYYTEAVSYLIKLGINKGVRFLDYGGGYGLFVRLMRDKGFNFFRQDYFCENLFANFFDIKDISGTESFDLLTAFEVFEHLENPLDEIGKMLKYSNIIIFSTELLPTTNNDIVKDWWYITPETGQHISFYTKRSLIKIAAYFNLSYYSFNSSWHIFYKSDYKPKKIYLINYLIKYKNMLNKLKFNRLPSLLTADYVKVKGKL